MYISVDLKERNVHDIKHGDYERKVLEVTCGSDITSKEEAISLVDKVEDELYICTKNYATVELLVKTPSTSLRLEVSYPFFKDIVQDELANMWEKNKTPRVKR